MELRVLSYDDVIEIYRELTGNSDGPVRPDGLESAVALPAQSMFGRDLYATIFDKAAALMRSIAENQPFLDGNKRTAWGAAQVFLAVNGVDVTSTVDEAVQVMIALAEKRIDITEVAEFLADRATFEAG